MTSNSTQSQRSPSCSVLSSDYVARDGDCVQRSVRKRSVVRVIAPSSIDKQSNVMAYRKFVCDSLGMEAHISDSIFQEGADPFYANTDRFRANDLIDALTDDSAVVWCALGGKGASRLIPYLDALPADQKQKITDARGKLFIGYSDITALHVYLHLVYGWQTIHGTMLKNIVDGTVDRRSVDALVALMTGRSARVEYELQSIGGGADHERDGESAAPLPSSPIRSKVAGGNLTLVENSMGTAHSFSGDGKLVFLEDIGVQPYSLERSLDHLKAAGVFVGAAASVFGSFKNSDRPDLIALVLRRFAATVPFPVFCVRDIGHGYVNNPLPLNTNATVSSRTAADGRVSYTLTVDHVYT
ncbi:LD-carboxypeptidase A, C-terminal domain,Peptidase family S66,Murein tetrapeptide [Cinara cedri]|uniref:LD-carboxypeptidase A, C-terminal domain,Peptidase family S66,Murein tetrapeptide n=1 Tax=Cinara cedri TaxID=506608 RepID=A0A5E4MA40_9HEMI|nr:LD-carboxypeptidase A, C-terminal domain,Peptidase family S66,Murein tetrapeptide [Cinara cedri]